MASAAPSFVSPRVRSVAVPGATVAELAAPAAQRLPRHAHERAYFCLLLAGGYAERWGDRALERSPLSLVFHPDGIEHQDEIGRGGARFLIVQLQPALAASTPPRALAATRELGVAAGGGAAWSALRLYAALADPDPLDVEARVHELVAALAPETPAARRERPCWLPRLEERLACELAAPLPLAALAAEAGVHPGHVARVFRRIHGRTPGELRQQARVRAVLAGLARGDALASLAADAGFADQAHLTRVFRRFTGTTPGRWQRALAARPPAEPSAARS